MKGESPHAPALLKEATHKKIQYLSSKRSLRDVDVYNLIKEFFREFLQLHYEFTFGELENELRKVYVPREVKEELVKLLKDFSSIEYLDEKVPLEKLKDIITRFQSIVDSLITRSGKQKTNFVAKLFGNKKGGESSGMTIGQPLDIPEQETKDEFAVAPTQGKVEQADEIAPLPTAVESSKSPVESEQPQSKSSWVAEGEKKAVDEPTHLNKSSSGALDEGIGKGPAWSNEEKHPVGDTKENILPWDEKTVGQAPENMVSEDNKAQEQEATEESAPVAQEHPDGWSGESAPEKSPAQEVIGLPEQENQVPIVEEHPIQEQQAPIVEEQAPVAQEQPIAEDQEIPVFQEQGTEGLATDTVDLASLAQQLDEIIKDDFSENASYNKDGPEEVVVADSLKEMVMIIDRLIVEGKLEEAKKEYKDLLSRYNVLSDHEKHLYFDAINRIYALLEHK